MTHFLQQKRLGAAGKFGVLGGGKDVSATSNPRTALRNERGGLGNNHFF